MMELLRYGESTLEHPIAIMGFPTMGLVGSIVSSYICKQLKMEVLAGFGSPDLMPYALVQDGIAYPPIRICGCKRGEGVDDLLIVTSEMSPKPEICYDVVKSLISTLKDMGVKMIVCIEGVIALDENTGIMTCGSCDNIKKEAENIGLTLFKDGLVRGISGMMMYMGASYDVDILTLLCPANPDLPDPRAAASLLEPLSKIVPGLELDAEPLYKEAEAIEKNIKEQQESQKTDMMGQLYG